MTLGLSHFLILSGVAQRIPRCVYCSITRRPEDLFGTRAPGGVQAGSDGHAGRDEIVDLSVVVQDMRGVGAIGQRGLCRSEDAAVAAGMVAGAESGGCC